MDGDLYKEYSPIQYRSGLLVKERPIVVIPALATMVGPDLAIIIQQLQYWLENKEKEKGNVDRCYKEGRYWVYNTLSEWQETNFPWWSTDQLGRYFRALEKCGLVLSKKFEVKNWCHRKWYTLNYEGLDLLSRSKILFREISTLDALILAISDNANLQIRLCERASTSLDSHISSGGKSAPSSISTEITSETTYIEDVEKEDTKEELSLDSTLNTPTCSGPAAKSKSLQVLLEEMVEIYNAHKVDWWASMRELGTRDVPFTKMVKTYGEDRILDMWRESLEAAKLDNWWGVQLDPKTGEKKKLSVTNYLSNSNWYNIREKHLDSLNTNVETSSLESIRQQILAILSELNMTAALPQQVRDATGCRILSELDQSQCVRYLNMLKRIKEKKQNQEGTAA